MNATERDQLQQFLSALRQTRADPKDPTADGLISDAFRVQADAPYLLVQRAMASLRSDRTSFVIAHRLSTIRNADVILVMEAGRIVEQGSHEDLIAAGGAYYTLYQTQFSAAVADPA